MEQRDFQLIEDGTWTDITEFCADLDAALEGRVDDDIRSRFAAWRPKQEEPKRQVRERSAKESSLEKQQIEAESAGAVAEMSNATQEAREGGKDLVYGRPKDTVKEVEEAGNSAVRGILPPLIRFFRMIEEAVYANIIGKTSPNYFESDIFTVAAERIL